MSTFDSKHARSLYTSDKYEEFLEYCLLFSEIDDASVIDDIARCFRKGNGTEKNLEKAIFYFKAAAEKGYAPAANSLGVIYRSEIVPADLDEAIYWFTYAIEKGDRNAMYNLAKLYHKEESKKDIDKALYWFKTAMENGDTDAAYWVGYIYKNESTHKNLELAIFWLEKSAEAGDSKAMYALGRLYKYDVADIALSIKWYEKAAEKGDSDAMYSLGRLYKYDVPDIALSTKWYEKAAEKGDSDAMLALGNTYKKIESVRDFDKALYWYKRSAQKGNVDGKHDYASLVFELQHSDKYEEAYPMLLEAANNNKEGAFHLLTTLAQNGSAMAQFFMGRYYTLKDDKTLALKWYREASSQGYVPAQNIILINYSEHTASTVDEIKIETGFIKETAVSNSQKLDTIVNNLTSINDKLSEIRSTAFTGNEETEDQEIDAAIKKSAEVINNIVAESPIEKVQKQKEALIKVFGAEVWNKLMPESQTSLVSSAVLLKDCQGMPADFDYTGICITAIVALEQELKQIFSDNYLSFLTRHNMEIPNIFTETDYFFSLGKLDKLFGYDKEKKLVKNNFNTRSMSVYLKEIVKSQYAKRPIYAFIQNNNPECIIARCLAINKKYRRQAAHSGNISYADAVDCCYEIYGETKALSEAKQNTVEIINILRTLFLTLK